MYTDQVENDTCGGAAFSRTIFFRVTGLLLIERKMIIFMISIDAFKL